MESKIMKVQVITVDPWKPALDLAVESWPAVIGGNGDCHIVLTDRWVKTRHCELVVSDGILIARDLGPKGETLINGKQIDTASLMPGDILTIGIRAFCISYRRRRVSPTSRGSRSKAAIDKQSKNVPTAAATRQ